MDDTVLQALVEINEHIAAKDQLELIEGLVRREVVNGEYGVFAERFVYEHRIVFRQVIIGETGLTAAFEIIARILRHVLRWEYPRPGLLKCALVDIRCIDQRSAEEAFLFQEDRQRIGLFAGSAPGYPDLDERIGREPGRYFFAQAFKKSGIAEHGGYRYGDLLYKLFEQLVVPENGLCQVIEAGDAPGVHKMGDTPLQGAFGVFGKVVAVYQPDGCQQLSKGRIVDIFACYHG